MMTSYLQTLFVAVCIAGVTIAGLVADAWEDEHDRRVPCWEALWEEIPPCEAPWCDDTEDGSF